MLRKKNRGSLSESFFIGVSMFFQRSLWGRATLGGVISLVSIFISRTHESSVTVDHQATLPVFHPSAYHPILSCPEGYSRESLSPSEESLMCVQSKIFQDTLSCPPGWTLTNDCVCSRLDHVEAQHECSEGFQRVGNMCVKDELVLRELVCPENYHLNEFSQCVRFLRIPANVKCTSGYTWSQFTSTCEKNDYAFPVSTCLEAFTESWETQKEKNISCQDNQQNTLNPLCTVATLRENEFLYFDDALRSCSESFSLRDQLCERISYGDPKRLCPPNFVLEGKQCKEMRNNCSEIPEEICIHSIPARTHCMPKDDKTHDKCRQKSIRGKSQKFSCFHAYDLYESEFDVRCLHISKSPQCQSQNISFYAHNDPCLGELQKASVICEAGRYEAVLDKCISVEYQLPLSTCSTVYIDKNGLKLCLKQDLVEHSTRLIPTKIQKTILCHSAKTFSRAVVCPQGFSIRYIPHSICVRHMRRNPTVTCPPGFRLIPPSLATRELSEPLCEKVDIITPSSQCPRFYHEGKQQVCVTQRFTPLIKLCPSPNDNLTDPNCLKRSLLHPLFRCPNGFKLQETLPMLGKQNTSCQYSCVKESYTDPVLTCKEGDSLHPKTKVCISNVLT